MQFAQTIPLSSGFAEFFSKDPILCVQHELEKNMKGIISVLSSYHWNEKGTVETPQIDVASIKMNETGEGKFKVIYGINITYGCSDISIDLDKSMTISIHIDFSAATATLTGEYIPEREPDEF